MKRTVLIFVAGAALLAGANLAFAHHSFTAAYDNTKRVEVEGVVKEFVWRNPHSFVRIDVTTKEGTTETWNLEWGSSSQLSAAKYPVTRTTIKAGDRIVATIDKIGSMSVATRADESRSSSELSGATAGA